MVNIHSVHAVHYVQNSKEFATSANTQDTLTCQSVKQSLVEVRVLVLRGVI